jgi:hypothetical protein
MIDKLVRVVLGVEAAAFSTSWLPIRYGNLEVTP